jgi:hypothetical protein
MTGQDCQAFYNASTGRWLSRDPVSERGGRNLFTFLRNQAIAAVDLLGQQGFEWQYPQMIPGGHTNSPGYTDWKHFGPEAQVYSPNGCCFGVSLIGGYARALVFWNPGTIFGFNILEHETYHVDHHFRPAYEDYKANASTLGHPCMTKPRAMCLKAVIGRELSHEYEERAGRDGAAYDWAEYGANNIDPEVRQDSYDRMASTQAAYEAAQHATAAAIAACPSN